MWWILLGSVASVVIGLLHSIVLELIVTVLGIQYAAIPVSYKSPAYMRISKASWGLGYTYIDGVTLAHRYGMFVSFRLSIVGYITSPLEENRMTAHVWSLRKGTITELIKRDNNATETSVGNYNASGQANWSYVRTPQNMRAWQSKVIDIIREAIRRAPQNCIVCLVTGAPGVGKSTLPLLLLREIEDAVDYVAMYRCVKNMMRHSGARRLIAGVDEIDGIMSDVTNDKRVAAVTKADWNGVFDHIHSISHGPLVILTSNNTYSELCKLAGEHAESMLRSGRVDIIVHVDSDGKMEVVREYA